MSTARIIDQTADSILSAGDYIIVDSQSEGTRKFDLGTSLNGIKEEIGDLSNLETDQKNNLVSSINEIFETLQTIQSQIVEVDQLIGDGEI